MSPSDDPERPESPGSLTDASELDADATGGHDALDGGEAEGQSSPAHSSEDKAAPPRPLSEDTDLDWTEPPVSSQPDDNQDVPPDATEAGALWALRRARMQTNPSQPSPDTSSATAEDLWAEPRLDDPPSGLLRSQERAAEAEALERLVRLNEEFRARANPDEASPETDERPPKRAWLAWPNFQLPAGKIIKSLLALLAVIVLAWVPLTRLLSITSAEATLNARLINLRAPIDGKVTFVAPSLAVGTHVQPNETLLRLTNPRADRQALDDLRRTLDRLKTESAALDQRIEDLKKIEDGLVVQLSAFQKGRISQLEARAGELASQLKGAQAQLEDAQKALDRSSKLRAQGFETVSGLLHAERDVKVAQAEVDALRKRLQSNQVELDGAHKGLFIGDSYNDRPRTSQRLDEVSQQIAELTSQLKERALRLTYLESELATETSLYAERSETNVASAVNGRVWEILTANGEDVQEGTDLLRILDCGGAVVTATVSESDYNDLWVGQPATFKLRGESREYPGTVVALTGLTPAGSNFAIEQSAFRREPYHVTVAVPELAALKDCNVGRTGRVTFDSSATPASASNAASTKAAPAAPSS